VNAATAQLYETDFYGWTQHQADLLRTRKLARLDIDNLLVEVESMGKSEQRELETRLEVLLMHLLKWVFQPECRSVSWEATIKEQRKRIVDHLGKNPSLKPRIPEAHASAYGYAVLGAVKETGLHESIFPAQSPWSREQALADTFWPETA